MSCWSLAPRIVVRDERNEVICCLRQQAMPLSERSELARKCTRRVRIMQDDRPSCATDG